MKSKQKRGLAPIGRAMRSLGSCMAVFMLLLSAGCLNLERKTPTFHYYLLEYEAPRISGLKPLKADIYVGRFVANAPYGSELMIYRDKKYGRDAYLYHRWRTRPAEMTQGLLARDMRESRVFHRVYREFLPRTASYELRGVVEEFLERNSSASREAVLSLRVMLSKYGESGEMKAPFFEKTYRAHQLLKQENPPGLASAMSLALREVSAVLIKDIHRVIERRATAGRP